MLASEKSIQLGRLEQVDGESKKRLVICSDTWPGVCSAHLGVCRAPAKDEMQTGPKPGTSAAQCPGYTDAPETNLFHTAKRHRFRRPVSLKVLCNVTPQEAREYHRDVVSQLLTIITRYHKSHRAAHFGLPFLGLQTLPSKSWLRLPAQHH